ncbi:PAS domain S-box protein [Marinifilum sp. RC60d5]|uniref:PAS domain S-box protein n=1 Tax=Marinifilum sp. RC60d5 TaxID=3458414 RepID=UPI004036D14C
MSDKDQTMSNLYKALVLNSGDTMFLFDQKGKIFEVNNSACHYLKYSREELLNLSVFDIAPEFQTPGIIDVYFKKLQKSKFVKLKSTNKRKDGSVFPSEVSLSLLVDNGQYLVLGIVRDISEYEQDKKNLSDYIDTLDSIHSILEQAENIEQMLTGVLSLIQEVFKTDRTFIISAPELEDHYVINSFEIVKDPYKKFFTNKNDRNDLAYSEKIYEQIRTITSDVYLSSTFKEADSSTAHSELIVPMHKIGANPYLLGIHQCSYDRKWSELEQKLFLEISRRLSYAIVRMFNNYTVQQSEEKYKILYDNAPLGYHSLDKNGNFVDVNQTWLNLLGYEKEEVIGKNYADLLHPDYLDRFVNNFSKFKSRGFVRDVHFKLRHKNGTYIPIALEGGTGCHPDGSFKQTYCVIQDITAKLKAEEELKASEAKLRYFIQQAPFPLSLVNTLTGEISYLNNSFFKMFGYSDEEISTLDKWWKLAFPNPDYREFVIKKWEKVTGFSEEEKASTTPQVYNIYCKDGSVKQTLVSGIALGNEFLTIMVDISAQKKIEQELIIAKERAEESEKLKSAFLANMSHEIRTPMNGILGFADLLKSPKLSGEKQQKYIDIILKSGDRMLSTINDIIEVSKIETNQVQPSNIQVNINAVIDHYYDFFEPEAKEKELSFNSSKALPAEQSVILTDQLMLDSILSNLIKNAIKYTVTGSIDFGYRDKGNYLEFFVKDTGIGIAANMQSIIFERFRQADLNNEDTIEGSGLGLAISKAYVEMLGGEIILKSELGKGSEFIFTIPVKRSKSKKIDVDSSTLICEADGKKLKVLIAEDDEYAREYLSILLKRISSEILIAENGEMAVELASKHSDIDLILMDMKMPKLNGYEATKQIRENNKTVPIIAQTAFALAGDREKTLQAGCNDFISKPVSADHLYSAVNRLIYKK